MYTTMNGMRKYVFISLGILLGGLWNCHSDSDAAEDIQASTTIDTLIFNKWFGRAESFRDAFIRVTRNVENLDSAIFYYDKSLTAFPEITNVYDTSLAKCYNNWATVLLRRQDYQHALKYFYNALTIWEKKADLNISDIATAYNNIGASYYNLREYEKAISYLDVGLKIPEAQFETKYNLRNHMGYALIKSGNPESGIGYLRQAAEMVRESPAYYARSLNGIGTAFQADDVYDSAVVYALKALNAINNSEQGSPTLLFSIHNTLGTSYRGLEKYSDALKHFQEAESYIINNKHPNMATLKNNLGYIWHHGQKDYEKALIYFHEALAVSIPDFISQDYSSYPTALKSANFRILASLKGKATSLHKLFLQNKDINYLKSSLKHFELAKNAIFLMRHSFTTDSDKGILANETLPIYEDAIMVAWRLFQLTKEERYLEYAFQFIQANKSTSLFESLQDRYARQFSDIPDSLLEKESYLKTNLFTNQRELRTAIFYNNEKRKQELQTQLLDQQKKYEDFIDYLENNHPQYHALKYGIDLATTNDAKEKLLNESTAILEYFIGDSTIYIFYLDKNQYTLKVFPKNDSLRESVVNLRKGIVRYSNDNTNVYFDTVQYIKHARKLYDWLIFPFESYIEGKDLLIMPDEVLHHLPFETLLSEVDSVKNYTKLPYLIRKHNISYGHSASLLIFNQNQASRNHKGGQRKIQTPFIAFAPGFGSEVKDAYRKFIKGKELKIDSFYMDSLRSMPHSIGLAESAQKILGGKLFKGVSATKKVFQEEARNCAILHIGTHAALNDQDPMLSYIAFAHPLNGAITNRDDYLLNVHDIYQHNGTNAGLVVLTACETGLGKLQRGEGAISLARGFSYIGTPSVLMSLWKIDDTRTSLLMETFYELLKNGKSKKEALLEAKKQMIQNEDFANPFYWSSIVLIGDTTPIDFPQRFNYIHIIGLLLLVLTFIFILKGRMKR